MIEFGSNKVRSIKAYCLSSLTPIMGKDEAHAVTYELFNYILGYRKLDIERNADESLNESTIVEFVHALRRLKKNEPLQYITGRTWFRDLELKVDRSVLIPRPETEELVELIINENKVNEPAILDICTGSGCIAIALSKEIKGATVTAIDVSKEALEVAVKNAESNQQQLRFIHADILDQGNALFKDDEFDIIVSNPPYVLRSEAIFMERNVLDHEPGIALFVEDDDPLLFYKVITRRAKEWLKNKGMIYFEINAQLGKEVSALLENSGFTECRILKDLSGKERFVSGKKI